MIKVSWKRALAGVIAAVLTALAIPAAALAEEPEEPIGAEDPVLEGTDQAGEMLSGAEPVEEDKAGTEPTNPAP
jgi:hypothetical protein